MPVSQGFTRESDVFKLDKKLNDGYLLLYEYRLCYITCCQSNEKVFLRNFKFMSAFTIRKQVRNVIELFIPTIIIECKKNVTLLEDRIYRKMFPEYILKRNTIIKETLYLAL